VYEIYGVPVAYVQGKLTCQAIARAAIDPDAAFATHEDSKSHSRVAVFIARVLVYAASKKQACITKCPTESELVTLSDYVGFVELFHEFLSFLISNQMSTPVIYQDSTSVIMLVTQGGGVT
jgi:hypothetical protein